jgi:phenylalanyl-tRNA synthetase beta chain
MKVPLSWLSEYVALPAKITSEVIAQAFVKVGFEVEGIEEQGKDLKGPLLVGKVLSIEENLLLCEDFITLMNESNLI